MLRTAWTAPAAISLLLALSFAPPGRAQDADTPSGYTQEELAQFGEFLAWLRPDAASGSEEARTLAFAQLAPYLERGSAPELLSTWLAWAKTEFAHPSAGWVGDRTATLVAFGPPGGIHREPSHQWKGEKGSVAPSAWDLMLALGGQAPRSPAEDIVLKGAKPTEIWVYPEADGSTLNLVYFVDVAGDGLMRMVLRKSVPSNEAFSEAPATPVPASLFGGEEGEVEVAVLQGARDLPELSEDPVTVDLDVAYLKATEGRTATRFVVALDPTDLELELDVDPAAYLGKAQVWLRVAKNGAPVYQDVFEPNAAALADLSGLYVDELTTVPLAPGTYEATILVTDGDGRGGVGETTVSVPSMEGELGLSSLLLSKATGGTIPKAEAAEDEFVAFRVGNYVVKPHVGGEFRAGDTLALVVQVYNAKKASLEYDLYKDGRLSNSLDPVQLKTLPQTDIQLIEVLDVWPSGSYAFRVTATSEGQSVSREVKFRVRK